MLTKGFFSVVSVFLFSLVFTGSAWASSPKAVCTLERQEYVSSDDDSYSLSQTQVLARKTLSKSQATQTGSHAPVSYLLKLLPDGSIAAKLMVKHDQYVDRQEQTGRDQVTLEVEDQYNVFKDRYVLECKSSR